MHYCTITHLACILPHTKHMYILTWKPASLRKTTSGQAGGAAALSSSAPASSRRPSRDSGPSCTARCSRALHRLSSRTLVQRSSSEKTDSVSDSCGQSVIWALIAGWRIVEKFFIYLELKGITWGFSKCGYKFVISKLD